MSQLIQNLTRTLPRTCYKLTQNLTRNMSQLNPNFTAEPDSWFDDENDTELLKLADFLERIRDQEVIQTSHNL